MYAKPTAIHPESEYARNGEPVAVDLLLQSELPHVLPSEEELLNTQIEFDFDRELALMDDEVPVLEAPEPTAASATKRGRPRSAANKVPDIDPNGPPVSVYQRLIDYDLLRKITDIVMAKVNVPWNLRKDAIQEVHTAWLTLKVNPKYQRNQFARYAYMAGQHAALKLRRTLGAVVVIPGALFRTGRDTSFMESIGAAVNPKDVEDYKDSLELCIGPQDELHMARVKDSFFEQRISGLNLSTRQILVARKALVDRMPPDDIAEELKISLTYIERMLNQVTNKLLAKDGADKHSPQRVTVVRSIRKEKHGQAKPGDECPTKLKVVEHAEHPAKRVVRRQRRLGQA